MSDFSVRTPGAAALALAAGLLLAPVPGAEAQDASPAPAVDPSLFDAMAWRNIGPIRGGRSIAVAGTPDRPLEYYFGATGGGVWKTTDAGSTWRDVTGDQLGTSSVGAMAQCYADPDVVWAGMGETEFRGNVIPGDGVYRSTDAGATWEHRGLESSTGQQMVARVRIHPTDCDRVYAAVFGDPFGPSSERGVFRSLDGGATWENVLFVSDRAGAVDLDMDPNDPATLYAGFWEAHRTDWSLESGGPGSGLYKTTDGGESWTDLSGRPGLPEGPWGKVGVSVSGANSSRVYAIIEAEEGGVFRSDDGGGSWEKVSVDRNLRQRAFYYTRIYADPRVEDRVYVLNVQFWRSDDGGETWSDINPPHGDNHDLWIAPNDNQRMIQSNDGGANVTWNGGETWTDQDFPTAQMYDVRVTNHFPYHVCGGQQDNSTACVPMDGDGSYMYAPGGCETGPVEPHPDDVELFYAACYGGYLSFLSRATGQERAINVWPVNPMGNSAEDLRERFQWNSPILASRHDPSVVYVASQHVFRSGNGGASWERISDDLTLADPATLGPSGGEITLDQTSVEYYGTVWRLAESPHAAGELWAGSDDGRLHVTRDDGATWTDVTPADLPRFSRIHEIDVSPHTPGKAYVAAVRYRSQDVSPYLYRTTDWGRTWTKITDGIPEGEYVRTVREDLQRPGLLYAGTEVGMLVSFDDGRRWQSLDLNLPTVQVPGLVLKDDDVVIATHGRSYWVLENVTPLRDASEALASRAAYLYPVPTSVRSLSSPSEPYSRRAGFRPEIDYYLGQDADVVQLQILDGAGEVIRTFTTDTTVEGQRLRDLSTEAGHHRVSWDMRYPGPRDFEGLIMWAANTQGPLAPPGSYQARLIVGGTTMTEPFQIVKDPRLTRVTQADFDAQFALSRRIAQRVDDAHRAVLQVRDVREQVEDRLERTDDARFEAEAESFEDRISQVEGEVYQVRMEASQDPLNFPIKLNNQIAALRGVVESADAAPTEQSAEAFLFLSGQLDEQLTRLRVLFNEDLAELNDRLRELGLEPIVVPDLNERRISF